jgi:hypothetical protein
MVVLLQQACTFLDSTAYELGEVYGPTSDDFPAPSLLVLYLKRAPPCCSNIDCDNFSPTCCNFGHVVHNNIAAGYSPVEMNRRCMLQTLTTRLCLTSLILLSWVLSGGDGGGNAVGRRHTSSSR